MPVSATRMTGV
ncbi:hypothetical protein BTO27_04755 [Wolbachia pipientis wAus]|nr:hypothetical protein BTO27_04755 [Wolbachia pipientis wAus]